jgi:hypothetical protein
MVVLTEKSPLAGPGPPFGDLAKGAFFLGPFYGLI